MSDRPTAIFEENQHLQGYIKQLEAQNKRYKEALEKSQYMLVWMWNKEANYTADELRAMAEKLWKDNQAALKEGEQQ
jgi:hypothetical protein